MSSYFSESFNNGIGALNHTWGNGIDTSVRGQVTVSGNSGIMENPWGAAAGHGYGTYSITASMSGHAAGPAALLWPGNDKWPGPEMDLAEFIGGRPYGTLHFNSGGNDSYGSIYYSGVDESKVHTYTLDWQPGKVTFLVDGRSYGGFSDNVGRDFDHGGINEVFSIMNRGGGTSITVYDISYSPSGGSQVEAEVTTSGSSGSTDAVLSADAVAQATANHDTSQYEGLPGWMWPAEARYWDV